MAKNSPLLLQSKPAKILRRYSPLLIALGIVAAFLITQPETARQMWQQIQSRLRPDQSQTQEIDAIALFNNLRRENNLAELKRNTKLDQAARLLAVAVASDPDQETFTVKEAAQIAGYNYAEIAYFALVYGSPSLTPPQDTLLAEENRKEILNPSYTEIGTASVPVPDSPTSIALVVVIAQPAKSVSQTAPRSQPTYYTGVQLWEEIQKYRVEHGVNPFRQDNVLCTIASIRVNQLLTLGTLDNHAGFEPLVTEYREKGQLTHSNVAENILSGYPTAAEAVAAWDSSLGHRALMRDGSYVWGCAAANYGFAALIAAF